MTSSQPDKGPGLGIDLGTCESCGFLGDKPVVLRYGESTIQSKVRIKGGRYDLPSRGTWRNIVGGAKRVIGRKIDDMELAKDAMVVQLATLSLNGAFFLVDGEEHLPEEVSGFILGKIYRKALADNHGEIPIIVATVPAYHNFQQRMGWYDAAYMGGLPDNVKLVDEQIAALVDFIMSHPDAGLENQVIIVVDVGGGTTDVAAVMATRTSGKWTILIKGTAGNNHAGGMDVDRALRDYVLQAAGDLEFRHNDDALLVECDGKKQELSTTAESVTITISGPSDNNEAHVDVSQEDFKRICQPTKDMLLAALEDLCKTSHFDSADIKNVLLVGGSSNLPCVAAACQERFPSAVMLRPKSGAESVARGAAILASDPDSVDFIPATPRGLGMIVHEGAGPDGKLVFKQIVPPNAQLPVKFTETCYTKKENESTLEIEIMEADYRGVKGALSLGVLTVTGIPEGPAGTEISVTVAISELGKFNVTATLTGAKGTTEETTLPVTRTPRLTKEERDEARERTLARLDGKAVQGPRARVCDDAAQAPKAPAFSKKRKRGRTNWTRKKSRPDAGLSEG